MRIIKKITIIFVVVVICISCFLAYRYYLKYNILKASYNNLVRRNEISYNHLINKDKASEYTLLSFAESHIDKRGFGRGEPYLGGGMIYYGIVQTTMSKVAVVIGSGAGFVPKIVAQAQKDIGEKAKSAVTYYIDADIDVYNHDTGQSYGSPDLDSIKLDTNLFLMRMRSSYAAKIFEQEGIKIDYLHIDGDHSVKGILEDWKYFYPLLSKNAVVTFHDYISVPDVAIALKKIKSQHPEINFIVFPNASAGIVVAQLGGLNVGEIKESPDIKTKLSYFENKNQIIMEEVFFPSEWKNNFKTYENTFNYLKRPQFLERYNLAAKFVDDGKNSVVEFGGFPNSIIYFLNNTKNVSLVEKYGTNQWIKEVTIESFKKKIDLSIYPTLADVDIKLLDNYNVVTLGFRLEYENGTSRDVIYRDVEKVFTLLVNSKKTILEFPNFKSSNMQFNFIKNKLRPNIIETIVLDNNDPGQPHNKIAIRNVNFIEGFNPIEGWNSPEIINEMVDIILSK